MTISPLDYLLSLTPSARESAAAACERYCISVHGHPGSFLTLWGALQLSRILHNAHFGRPFTPADYDTIRGSQLLGSSHAICTDVALLSWMRTRAPVRAATLAHDLSRATPVRGQSTSATLTSALHASIRRYRRRFCAVASLGRGDHVRGPHFEREPCWCDALWDDALDTIERIDPTIEWSPKWHYAGHDDIHAAHMLCSRHHELPPLLH